MKEPEFVYVKASEVTVELGPRVEGEELPERMAVTRNGALDIDFYDLVLAVAPERVEA